MNRNPRTPGLSASQCGYVLLKELLKLLFGEHGVDDLEDGLFVFVFELVDQGQLLEAGFLFQTHFFGHIPVII
ncbi:MAG TPA: hypothetical protein DCE78_00395 [Bacteroidetes bacterium]|nr:hypothetical protein [Bacteroidota bacterium]